MPLYPELQAYLQSLEGEFAQIPKERKDTLSLLAKYVIDKRKARKVVSLNFICTHNSRRSHISQIWAATAAAYFDIDGVSTYSGGTEATAFNPRAVAAMERAGFRIGNPGGENPRYRVSFSDGSPALECFSKTFNDPFNPQSDFAAIMTCSDADANCPFVPGAEMRIPITYEDPKVADDTPEETNRYDERVRQIGREILFAFHLVQQHLP
jgi:arsenate reductase